jgi:hypothetical protein
MNDNDRELIQSVLTAAGRAGEQGFAYLVQYTYWDGVFSVIGYAIALAGSLWLLRRAFMWKRKPNDDEIVSIVRGFAIVILCMVSFGMLCGVQQNLVQTLQPEGAAIHDVLAHPKE